MIKNELLYYHKMFCLKVIIADPDYKRPSVNVIVEHFATENEAHGRLKEIKLKYINDYGIFTNAIIDYLQSTNSTNDIELKYNEKVEEQVVTIEEFDKLLKANLIDGYIYQDSYMCLPAFDWKIFEVKLDSDYYANYMLKRQEFV